MKMHDLKKEIRQDLRQQRDALSALEVSSRSRRIVRRVVAMAQFEAARCLSCYVSRQNEVDTHRLIEMAIDQDKVVGAPVSGEDGRMDHFSVQSLSELLPGRFGILEPRSTHPVPEMEFELVVIPGIAFDRLGNRIGSGGGYYDRFLSGISAFKIGLGFDFQMMEVLPSESHDVRLDAVVTESGIFVSQ